MTEDIHENVQMKIGGTDYVALRQSDSCRIWVSVIDVPVEFTYGKVLTVVPDCVWLRLSNLELSLLSLYAHQLFRKFSRTKFGWLNFSNSFGNYFKYEPDFFFLIFYSPKNRNCTITSSSKVKTRREEIMILSLLF